MRALSWLVSLGRLDRARSESQHRLILLLCFVRKDSKYLYSPGRVMMLSGRTKRTLRLERRFVLEKRPWEQTLC